MYAVLLLMLLAWEQRRLHCCAYSEGDGIGDDVLEPMSTECISTGCWDQYFDEEHQFPYFYNKATGESRWEINSLKSLHEAAGTVGEGGRGRIASRHHPGINEGGGGGSNIDIDMDAVHDIAGALDDAFSNVQGMEESVDAVEGGSRSDSSSGTGSSSGSSIRSRSSRQFVRVEETPDWSDDDPRWLDDDVDDDYKYDGNGDYDESSEYDVSDDDDSDLENDGNVLDDNALPPPGNWLPDAMHANYHLSRDAGGTRVGEAALEHEKRKRIVELNKELAKYVDPETKKIPNIEMLKKKGGLLNAEELAKYGLKIIEHLDEVWVKAGGSMDENCGRENDPCGTIQLGISRSSMHSKVYVGKGHYSGEGNVNLKTGGRTVDIVGRPKHQATIDCQKIWPLVNMMHSQGNTGIRDFEIRDCNIQDNNGQALHGNIESANIKLPNINYVWSPAQKGFVPDPWQLQQYQLQQKLARQQELQAKKRNT